MTSRTAVLRTALACSELQTSEGMLVGGDKGLLQIQLSSTSEVDQETWKTPGARGRPERPCWCRGVGQGLTAPRACRRDAADGDARQAAGAAVGAVHSHQDWQPTAHPGLSCQHACGGAM